MRDLTQKEIDDAPDWATHYSVAADGCVMYESSGLIIWTGLDSPRCNIAISATAKPIPRKQEAFDIYQAKTSSGIKFTGANSMYVNVNYLEESAVVAKIDVIALAKHFNLTAEDLK